MRTEPMSRIPARAALALCIVAVAGFVALGSLGGQANAQVDPYSSGSPTVLPTRVDNTVSPGASPTESPTVLPTTITRRPPPDDNPPEVLPSVDDSGLLPFTGADLTLFAATGASTIGTGYLLVRRSRRRR